MTTDELIESDVAHWRGATRHPFLEGVRDGTLAEEAFFRWLAQDYRFALVFTRAEGRYLAHAPREDFEVLAQGIEAMVQELRWFERKAGERGVNLAAPLSPAARAYVEYLQAVSYEPYAVQLTSRWVLERAYLEGWRTTLPGAPAHREFVEHWAHEAYVVWVCALEGAVNRALAQSAEAERDAFRWIARYERDFWQMAYTGSHG